MADEPFAQTITDTCTCEYPYPAEIWAGHHPNCATNTVAVYCYCDYCAPCAAGHPERCEHADRECPE